jgi:glycerophosphoryl diester phosphodiesterase
MMVIHDATLDRTTDGEGLVAEQTFEALRGLDAGKWKSPEFEGESMPTLDEALRLIEGRAGLAIEIKAPGIEGAVVEAMVRRGRPQREAEIFCFDRGVLETIGRLDPGRRTVWLFAELPRDPAGEASEIFEPARQAGIEALGISRRVFSAGFLERAHAAGLAVYLWTVNDRVEIESLARAGVDAIVSDRPDLVLETLRVLSR